MLAGIALFFAGAIVVDFVYAEVQDTWRFDEYGPATTAKAFAAIVAGGLGVMIWRAMPAEGKGWRDGRNFWLLAGIGLIFTGIDDYFLLHETVSREVWERWGFDPPVVHHTDDLIVALYGLAGLCLVVVYWREIVHGGLSGVLLIGALAAAAVMTVSDAVADKGTLAAGLEDPAHIVSAALFLAAFVVKWMDLREGMRETGTNRPAFAPVAEPE